MCTSNEGQLLASHVTLHINQPVYILMYIWRCSTLSEAPSAALEVPASRKLMKDTVT